MTLNVKDFGAVGNGVADDTAAIQAAINSVAGLKKGEIYFPPCASFYNTTAPIAFHDAGELSIIFRGEGAGSAIRGNFSGYVLDRNSSSPGNGPVIIDGLSIRNIHANGGGVRACGTTNGIIRNSTISANGICVDGRQGTFSFTYENLVLRGSAGGCPVGSVGILAGGHSVILNCDVVGLDHGIRASGAGVSIIGGRIEVNRVGVMAGMDGNGGSWPLSLSLIAGISFEANDTAIYFYHVSSSKIEAIGIQGTVNAPSGSSDYGLRSRFMTACGIESVIPNGGYDVAAIAFDIPPAFSTVRSVWAQNSILGKPAWILPADLSGLSLEQCNN